MTAASNSFGPLPGSEPEIPRRRHQRAIRRGGIALLACALGAGAFTIADALSSHGATAGASQSQKVQTFSSNSISQTPVRGKTGGPGGWVRRDFAGPGGAGIGGALLGKVTAIGSGTITLTTAEGTSQTIDTTSSTRYYTMNVAATSAAISLGDQVAVVIARPAPSASSSKSSSSKTTSVPTTPKAAAVVDIKPFATGSVVSATAGEIVVKSDGLERDILVGGSTSYTEAGATIPASAVAAGETVFAWGSAATDPTQLQASNVIVTGPSVSGEVSSISGTTITLTTQKSTETVTTTGTTIFRSGTSSSTLSALQKGDLVQAIGTSPSAGTFAATAVTFIAPPSPSSGGGWAPQAGVSRPLFGGLGGPGGLGSFGGLGGGGLAAIARTLLGS